MSDTTGTLRAHLRQLNDLHQAGVLDAQAFVTSKTKLERQLLDAVLAEPVAPDMPGAVEMLPQPHTPPTPATPATPAAPASTKQASKWLWPTCTALALMVAGWGYAWTVQPSGMRTAANGPASASAAGGGSAATTAPHALSGEPMQAMVAQLAVRLQTQPDDADGWGMLGRSYMALGRPGDALAAYERALKLRPDDTATQADHAAALAANNGALLDGVAAALAHASRTTAADTGTARSNTSAGRASTPPAQH